MLDRTRLACELALRAGAFLREAAGRHRSVEFKSAVDLVTEVDRGAQALIVDAIRRAFPDDAIVAEEDGLGSGRGDSCWVIDPLDGTTNFVHGLPHFSVSIGYLEGGRALSAAVYDPCRDELFHAERGLGAFVGTGPSPTGRARRLAVSTTATLDRSLLVTGFPYDRRDHVDLYLDSFRQFLLKARDVRRYGSAALDLCYVAAGRFDGFWEWKLNPWDTAAGWLLVEEAGGLVTDFDGAGWNPWIGRILATNGAVHPEAIATLATRAAS